MTEEEANAWVSAYNRDRCECGGSPAWVPVEEQLHMADCARLERDSA